MVGDSVLIVEDHQLLAQAVAAALVDEGLQPRLVDPAELDEVIPTVERGTLVLLDLRLGHGRDGTRAVAPLTQRGARVVVVTGTTDPVPLAHALESGALAIVDKHQPFTDLVSAIVTIRSGEGPVQDERRAAILAAAARRRAEQASATALLGRLSSREQDVLDHLCQGLSAQEIAQDAGVSLTTVRAQIRSVLVKLGVRSQLQAVARAHDLRRQAGDQYPQSPRPTTRAGRGRSAAGH
ncbi:response regulator transcription factor [Actinotalea fermentans]|uniref:DNA-binding response regulator n=1 Tax=Actinotalea fermentans TaxID=43671 RepID=A0A511YV32_9CELL|nr:response regulator transcription factor [Actinotalea fermentans]KGM17236.1 hypothetical protein N867_07840 [Actinotalea fermentans ATCC 43279 = JCM 9966 = DSM 3133]GEN79043.1 DNA-binding response regulator [Actinotalea fermentans]